MNNIEKIKELIKKDNLSGKSRIQEDNYRRCYLMNELRESGMTMVEIGKLFKRHHALVIHNIRQHKWMVEIKDKVYTEYTSQYKFILDGVDRQTTRSLVEDIMKCNSYGSLKIIKSRIKRGIYAQKAVTQ